VHILMIGGLVPWHPAAGGGQVIAYNLAYALARGGHQVDYVAVAPEPMQRSVDWGEFTYIVPENGFPSTILRVLRGVRDRDMSQYDLVHVHADSYTLGCYLGQVVRRAISSRPRLAVGIYIPQAYRFPRSVDELGWMCLCRAADVVFTLSNFSARNVARAYYVPLSRVQVMHGGVDESFFTSGRTVGQTPSTLLFCGRMVGQTQGRRQQKGIDVLLQAMPAILAHHSVKLEIVGKGPLLSSFQAMARDLGVADRVKFTGFVEYNRMPEPYSRADLFVLPSRRESFGLVLVEAMAAGLPVVATSVGAIPEVIIDGETGILVPPENPSALADAVNNLLGHPQMMKDMGARGRERVERHFTWARVAERVAASYREILDS
jgi:glycosyltransferase involved in cell wall biosynthesis